MTRRKDKLVAEAAEVFADGAAAAARGNLERGNASPGKRARTAAQEQDRVERVAAAKERFEGLSRYEILADLDDIRSAAIRACLDPAMIDMGEGGVRFAPAPYKAALDISKFLIEQVDQRPEERPAESREDILAEQRAKNLGRAGAAAN